MWATIGWSIATFLLQWLLRGSSSSNSDGSTEAQPSKYTDSNANQIGSPVPVVLGRALIKNPLISYYGAFNYNIYTEEYGLHTDLDLRSFWWPLLLALIIAITTEDTVVVAAGTAVEAPTGKAAAASPSPVGGTTPSPGNGTLTTLPGQSVTTSGGAGSTTSPGQVQGKITFKNTGTKRAAIVNVIVWILMWLLTKLFNDHEGRTTIQKGFLYYLGWQHIICWTGDSIGIKKLWMNVYDPDVEESTNKGVWDNDAKVAWKKDNPTGITAHIEDDQMFGGWDEGGGFIGDVRFYFGTYDQPKDPWMIKEMKAPTIPTDLQGLTPRYPMYFTCVVSDPNLDSGAYIGKQATIPEMWFEVVNYPNRLTEAGKDQVKKVYFDDVKKAYQKLLNYIGTTPESFHDYMKPWHGR